MLPDRIAQEIMLLDGLSPLPPVVPHINANEWIRYIFFMERIAFNSIDTSCNCRWPINYINILRISDSEWLRA